MKKLYITEGIHGTWYYHLSTPDRLTRGLCGNQTMPTSLPLASWGTVSHLRERYCEKCQEAARETKPDSSTDSPKSPD